LTRLFAGRALVARRPTAFSCLRARATARLAARTALRLEGAALAAASAACDPSLAAAAAACAAVFTAVPTAVPTNSADLIRMSSAGRLRLSDILVLRRVTYIYEPDVLDALARHGLAPGPSTPPPFVRDALSDLYRYEIRRLRRSFVRGEIPKADYSPHVIALRRKYWLLSVSTVHWAQDATGHSSPHTVR
jgi:hypothetical protein